MDEFNHIQAFQGISPALSVQGLLKSPRVTLNGIEFKDCFFIDLKREFEENHFIRIKNFLSEDLLARVQSTLNEENFYLRKHPGIADEYCLKDCSTLTLLSFLMNSPSLFSFAESLIGGELHREIKRFDGRVYRLNPGEHQDDWHDDVGFSRVAALSVNIGDNYSGGKLQIRDRITKKHIATVPASNPGDAVIFRVSEKLEHRVTEVKGTPRTAFAGWFQTEPDYWKFLK